MEQALPCWHPGWWLTMSTISAMVMMMMAAMAQVLRAQRVLSIQVEKATSFLGKTCKERKVAQMGHSDGTSWTSRCPITMNDVLSHPGKDGSQ